MDSSYGIAVKGTSAQRLMLWGPLFPTLEINVEDDFSLPTVTMIGFSGMGNIIQVHFNEDAQSKVNETSYDGVLHPQAHGWGMAVTDDHKLIIEDPKKSYRFVFEMTSCGLNLFLDCLSHQSHTMQQSIARHSLEEHYAWPTLNIPHLASTLIGI